MPHFQFLFFPRQPPQRRKSPSRFAEEEVFFRERPASSKRKGKKKNAHECGLFFSTFSLAVGGSFPFQQKKKKKFFFFFQAFHSVHKKRTTLRKGKKEKQREKNQKKEKKNKTKVLLCFFFFFCGFFPPSFFFFPGFSQSNRFLAQHLQMRKRADLERTRCRRLLFKASATMTPSGNSLSRLGFPSERATQKIKVEKRKKKLKKKREKKL